MALSLSDYQKSELKNLFGHKEINYEFLFANIEHNLAHLALPKTREVLANDTVVLLSNISKKAKQLRLLIGQLDSKKKQDIDYCLANQILEIAPLTITNEFHKKSNSLEMLSRLERHCDFQSDFTKERYGTGAWDQIVDAICHSWPTELAMEKKITLNCKLVKFFSIITDEFSHEASRNRITRSPWYKQHFEIDISWQDKL